MTMTKPMSRCDSSVSIRPLVWSASTMGMLSCWMNCSTASLDGSLGPCVTKRTLLDNDDADAPADMADSLFGDEACCCGFLFDFDDFACCAAAAVLATVGRACGDGAG